VEWDTHKTVLVEVPGAPPVDADVEMEGMGLNRKDEGYGRLDDDWDDHEVSLILVYQVLDLEIRNRMAADE